MKHLTKILLALVYSLPAVLFFSYYPVISFGSNASMNFELSLPLIWLVLFDLTAFVALAKLGLDTHRAARKTVTKSQSKLGHNFPGISDKRFFFFSFFPFFATLSIFWSANPVRAILTAGIIWLLFFAIFALVYILPLLELPKHFRQYLLGSFLISSAVICVVCWVQALLDVAGLSREQTLLCLGCTSYSFGFPHPSGFAIEPQFMGNLLLAPTLTALYLLIFHHPCRKKCGLSKRQYLWCIIFACLFSATLFLTFSRGAIYAYAVALAIMLGFALVRKTFRLLLILIPATTFIFVLLAQGIMAQLGPTAETFRSALGKSIHQLSLGVIDLRVCPACTVEVKDDDTATEIQNEDVTAEAAMFDGYVAESTNIRLNLNAAAFDTWLSAPDHPASGLHVGLRCFDFDDPCPASGLITPTSVFFGVGLGGAGTALYRNRLITQIGSPKEIVQNQYFSLLLELGLVGLGLALFGLYLAFFTHRGRSDSFWMHPALPLLVPLLIAYLITLNFFSGLPNALHIYLLPPLLYMVLLPVKAQSRSKHSTKAGA